MLHHVGGSTLRAVELKFVAEAVHVQDGRHPVLWADRVYRGHLNLARAFANHLAHAQSAAGHGQCAEAAPVIAASLAVDTRGAAKFAGYHHKRVLQLPSLG